MDAIEDIFDDFIDAIVTFFTEMLAGFASKLIHTSLTLFNTGIGNKKYVQDPLTALPNEWNADMKIGGDQGMTIFDVIQGISENVIAPIGGMILVLILLYDLINTIISGNNFHEFDTAIFFKWIFKCLCGIILISNTSYLIMGIFSMGSGIAKGALGYIGDIDLLPSTSDINQLSSDLCTMLCHDFKGDWGVLCTFVLFAIIMFIVTIASLVIVMLVLTSRMIEVFMYIAVAPIPMATFMNHEWGDIGRNWLRNILSLAFQTLFIVVAISIFSAVYLSVLQGMLDFDTENASDSSVINLYMSMLTCITWSIALCFTVFRSTSISKSVFNAH